MNRKKSGFNSDQIINKTSSLVGVLDPFSTKGNLNLFKRVGIKDIYTLAKYVYFELYLIVK
tara:strand:- start:81 stop:263 length:183 start_codon:yes stop_codon:yes gene_type:complete